MFRHLAIRCAASIGIIFLFGTTGFAEPDSIIPIVPRTPRKSYTTHAVSRPPRPSMNSWLSSAGSSIPPEADIGDDFSADPRLDTLHWSWRGLWTWNATTGVMLSSPLGKKNLAYWKQTFTIGRVGATVKLFPSATAAPPKAKIVFAQQTLPTGGTAYRYVTLVGGTPGKVILGQKGIIDGLPPDQVLRSVDLDVPVGSPLKVTVDILDQIGDLIGVRVFLDDALVLAHETLPAAAGQVGLGSTSSKVSFDDFYFIDFSKPNHQPCRLCHADQAGSSPAPNVMRYWDGTWWDTYMGGSPTLQEGGHGDQGNYPALTCTGSTGCHDMRKSAATHRNNIHEGRGNPTANTYHLRSIFINSAPVNPWNFQVSFDNACLTACHERIGVRACAPHESDGDPAPLAVLLGTFHTTSDGASLPYPLDEDMSTHAAAGAPYYVTCVSCHDPHGTNNPDRVGSVSNRMIRDRFNTSSALCLTCHQ